MNCRGCAYELGAEAAYCERCGCPVAGRHVRLILEQGLTPGRQYLLSQPRLVIGKAMTAAGHIPDIDLGDQADATIHRAHATLIREGDALYVEDGANANPTIVNNRRLGKGERVAIRAGDRIRVGNTVLVLR